MTFNFLGPGLTVNVEAKVKEQIILDSSEILLPVRCGDKFLINQVIEVHQFQTQ